VSEAENGAERVKNPWSWGEAGAGGRGAGNGAESGSHRNKFERGAENMALPPRSHALIMTSDNDNDNDSDKCISYSKRKRAFYSYYS